MIFPLSGGIKLFAAIDVIYPAGSTLTCTNGSKTLTAETTTGHWVFTIPEEGTWTVRAERGANSKVKDVVISGEGQFESVVLEYSVDLYNSTITSGWATKKALDDSGSGSISSGKMVLDGDMAYGGAASYYYSFYYYTTKVECSSDKVLKIDVTTLTPRARLIIVSALSAVSADRLMDVTGAAYADIQGTGVTTLPLVDGSYYVGVLFDGASYLEATRVWVE